MLATMAAPFGYSRAAEWTDRSPHHINFVSVAPDVHLEVLDWGGGGTPLVFLAGLTNNAHVFDDFAPRFSDHYHAIGITRRGHGASSWPDSGYDPKALAHDLTAVLDALKLPRVILAGHSIAGTELTRFATEHPERIVALVYIDAAYDMTLAGQLMRLCPAAVQQEDGLAEVLRHFRDPEQFLHTQFRAGSDGKRQMYASLAAIQQIAASQTPPDFSGVRAPALGVFYLPSRIEDVFRDPPRECASTSQRYYYQGAADFATHMSQATVINIPNSQHNLHLASPDELERAMRSFLGAIVEPSHPVAVPESSPQR